MRDFEVKRLGFNVVDPLLHKIVILDFEKRCTVCDRSIYQGEECIYNFIKKINKHIKCSEEEIMKKPRWDLTSRSIISSKLYASGAARPDKYKK